MPGAITEAIGLQRTAFMAFRQTGNTPKLEVYTFSAKEPTSEEPSPILRAVYLLPELQNGVEMALNCRCDPPPFQYSHLAHPDISSVPIDTPDFLRRPFEMQETSRTLAFALSVRPGLNAGWFGSLLSRDLAIFVPLQTFISTDLDSDAPPGEPRVIPASEWMHSSRVLADLPFSNQWVFGTRFATLSPEWKLCIYDFNPSTIAYLKHHQERKRSQNQLQEPGVGQSEEGEGVLEWREGNADVGLVSTEWSFTDQMFFKEPLRSGAPFLVSVSEHKIDVTPNEILGVMIDDERVLLVQVGGSSSV